MSTLLKILEGAVILEAVCDYSLTSPTINGNPTLEAMTEMCDSVLSGPR